MFPATLQPPACSVTFRQFSLYHFSSSTPHAFKAFHASNRAEFSSAALVCADTSRKHKHTRVCKYTHTYAQYLEVKQCIQLVLNDWQGFDQLLCVHSAHDSIDTAVVENRTQNKIRVRFLLHRFLLLILLLLIIHLSYRGDNTVF